MMIKKIKLAAAILLTATLTACNSAESSSASNTKDSTANTIAEETVVKTESEKIETTESDKAVKLYIGRENDLKEIDSDSECNADALIAAISEETGWDLTLEKPVSEGPYVGGFLVQLSENSILYSDHFLTQKENFTLETTENMVYSVLNSIAETLEHNLNTELICFAAPDGGDIEFERDGFSFYLAAGCPWDEDYVQYSLEPTPEDSLGKITFIPNESTLAGLNSLTPVINRVGVVPNSGIVTVYNVTDGEIFTQIDVAEEGAVTMTDISQNDKGYLNWKEGSTATINLGKQMEPNKKYEVTMEAGTFTADGRYLKEIKKGSWFIECLDYGFGESNIPDKNAAKAGNSYTQEILLGDSAECVTITSMDPEALTVSPGELTEDGTITLTIQKDGGAGIIFSFTLKDGRIMDFALALD